jgi:lysyl-tRNA synthetase class 1
MSSSTGNTIGPLEALELVPPEILRYLIASTKPKKAITFDAGMSLVELADEYERLLSRNLDEEMADDSLSRRQKVALEDAEGALRMSKIGDSGNTNVSFRHLAMLAQVKSDDEIINTIGEKVSDRLNRMRNWISGPHFPEELRIEIRDETMQGLDPDIINCLKVSLSNCEWNSNDIGNAISTSFKENEISPREGYRNLYLAILGVEKGPRLAPILSEVEKERILNLLEV